MVIYYKCSKRGCNYLSPVEMQHCPRCKSYMEEKDA